MRTPVTDAVRNKQNDYLYWVERLETDSKTNMAALLKELVHEEMSADVYYAVRALAYTIFGTDVLPLLAKFVDSTDGGFYVKDTDKSAFEEAIDRLVA